MRMSRIEASRGADNEPEAWTQVAQAFGRKARLYDEFGRDHPNLERMRAVVRAQVLRLLPAGSRLLEINAGSGADACFFASQGYHVHATDLSPGMLDEIRSKARQERLAGRLTIQQLSYTELGQVDGGPFDCVFSNMGGLNCAPDLAPVARALPAVLKPGGVLVWVVMPPICPWEIAQLARGRLRLALRRLRPGGVIARVEGLPVPTYYYTPGQVQAALGADFQRLSLQGLAVFTPPADHKDFPLRHPLLYRRLLWLEERLAGRAPFNHMGDFYILCMRYLPRSGAQPA